MKTCFKQFVAMLLVLVMIFSLNASYNYVTAAATMKISTSKVSITVGKSTTVKLTNAPKGAEVVWSSKNTKIAKVKAGKITGVKAGSTSVVCKVTYTLNRVTKTKTFTIKVIVKKSSNAKAKDSNLTKEHKSANGITTKDDGVMRTNLSTLDLINQVMGPGWNLGNQMEQSNWQGNWKTVEKCETSAGNTATQKTFDGLKSYGVNTVRIPIAWSNFMSDDGKYTINKDLFNRVEEIINYALNNQMYVIINIHWDGAWWGRFGAEKIDAKKTPIRDEAWKKYEAIWTQIANRYKEYSDHLIFEGANEELSGRLNDDYMHPEKGESSQTGVLSRDSIYQMVNKINQKFVDVVRSTGGNNRYRHLLIPGTGDQSCLIDGTIDKRFKMPRDSVKGNGNSKLSVSVHYYDPTDYGISATSTTSWGYRDSWGTKEDYKYMNDQFDKLKNFTDKGYGVIIGECGCVKGYKNNVIDYLTELYKNAKEVGACAVLWDEGHYFERKNGYFAYGDVGDFFAKMTGSKPVIPQNAKLVKTGISAIPSVENQNPKVVYTWEGEFMRHTSDADATRILKEREGVFDKVKHGIGFTTSITNSDGKPTDALQVEINDEFWNLHLTTDWSKIKEPCLRVYPADNAVSQASDLQLGYLETRTGGAKFDVDYDSKTGQFWSGKYIKLDAENLKGGYPWLWITTNTYSGCSYVKIEICDGAYNADGSNYEK